MNAQRLLPTALLAAALPILAQEDLSFANFESEKGRAGSQENTLCLMASAGYGFRMGGAEYPASAYGESQERDAAGDVLKVSDHYLNYGQGIKLEIGGEFGILPNVGAEVEVMFTGRVPRTKIEYDSPTTTWEEKWKQACFGIKLLAVPRFTIFDLLDMHIGFGAGLFFTSLTFTNSDPARGLHEGYVKTRPALAFVGKLGVDYPLTDILYLTIDLATEQASFTLTKYRRTDDTTVYLAERNREPYTSNNVVRPEKLPGTNLAIKLGIRVAVL